MNTQIHTDPVGTKTARLCYTQRTRKKEVVDYGVLQ